jgi:hypothetical protein
LVMLTPRVIRLPERLAESGKEVSVGVGAAAPTVPTTPGPETPPQPEAAPEQPGQPRPETPPQPEAAARQPGQPQ